MLLGELAEILVSNAKTYRNEKLSTEIVPRLVDQPIVEKVVRQVIEPYLEQVNPHLPQDVQLMLQKRFNKFASVAMIRVKTNSHLHNGDNSGFMSQNNADAILTVFVNDACVPLDLALYAQDLLPKA